MNGYLRAANDSRAKDKRMDCRIFTDPSNGATYADLL